jgi:hypothetical protein
MKRMFMVLTSVLSTCFAYGQTKQAFTAGWDIFDESLNYSKSSLTWSVHSKPNKLVVTNRLVGATPNKLYEVGIVIFCATFPDTFGQLPVWGLVSNTCRTETRQGVTKTLAYVDVGVVTTDRFGNGSFSRQISPVPAGTYDVEFFVRNGAGCNLAGGGNNTTCAVDFQSPGPTFGDSTTITVP